MKKKATNRSFNSETSTDSTTVAAAGSTATTTVSSASSTSTVPVISSSSSSSTEVVVNKSEATSTADPVIKTIETMKTNEEEMKPPFTTTQILGLEAARKAPRASQSCAYCRRPENSNPLGVSSDKFLTCFDCGSSAHALQCLNYRPDLVDNIRARRITWQCIDCKRCVVCTQTCESLLFCDRCDRAYHKECCQPPLRSIPKSDSWVCHVCKWEDEQQQQHRASAAYADVAEVNNNTKKPKKTVSKKPKAEKIESNEDLVTFFFFIII